MNTAKKFAKYTYIQYFEVVIQLSLSYADKAVVEISCIAKCYRLFNRCWIVFCILRGWLGIELYGEFKLDSCFLSRYIEPRSMKLFSKALPDRLSDLPGQLSWQSSGLKIRVSVVRVRPRAPLISKQSLGFLPVTPFFSIKDQVPTKMPVLSTPV